MKQEKIEDWLLFYNWLNEHNYYIIEKRYIFRKGLLICSFDPQEDADSGEIEETIKLIKEKDVWKWKK